MNKNKQLFQRALKLIPGGVNSPVRAFNAVGGNPLFIKSAKGAYLSDENGKKYIDLINSWGPMIFGHKNQKVEDAVTLAVKDSPSFGAPGKREVEIAELIIDMVPSIEKVRMVNSGTEATMSAIRVARGYTGKDKILKFEGCYHGHGDSFLIAAGSGAVTMGQPNSPGVTRGTVKDTLLSPFNDLGRVEDIINRNPDKIAAIILEPVVGNMGCVPPNEGFLSGLRNLCDRENIVLIFDEVMTGFRLSKGGAQELYDVMPDMTTLGKIIGGGLPVGAYGGKREIMDCVSPVGPVYQAGTLSGNPVAMAAGIAVLTQLNEDPEVYQRLASSCKQIADGIRHQVTEFELPFTVNQIGSMYSLFFTDKEVTDFEDAQSTDVSLFGIYFRSMLEHGIYLAPSQFESLFISDAIRDLEIEKILSANKKSLEKVKEAWQVSCA